LCPARVMRADASIGCGPLARPGRKIRVPTTIWCRTITRFVSGCICAPLQAGERWRLFLRPILRV